jgi:hypothetical protein
MSGSYCEADICQVQVTDFCGWLASQFENLGTRERRTICRYAETLRLPEDVRVPIHQALGLEEVVHSREPSGSGDTVRKIDGEAWIAGPQRIAPLAVFCRIAAMLLNGMHSEAATAIEPALLAGAPEEF